MPPGPIRTPHLITSPRQITSRRVSSRPALHLGQAIFLGAGQTVTTIGVEEFVGTRGTSRSTDRSISIAIALAIGSTILATVTASNTRTQTYGRSSPTLTVGRGLRQEISSVGTEIRPRNPSRTVQARPIETPLPASRRPSKAARKARLSALPRRRARPARQRAEQPARQGLMRVRGLIRVRGQAANHESGNQESNRVPPLVRALPDLVQDTQPSAGEAQPAASVAADSEGEDGAAVKHRPMPPCRPFQRRHARGSQRVPVLSAGWHRMA
jgi:hypothetical protein